LFQKVALLLWLGIVVNFCQNFIKHRIVGVAELKIISYLEVTVMGGPSCGQEVIAMLDDAN